MVGTSGAGKTTLGRLLLGLTRPGEGALVVGGGPLTGADLEWWRDRVAWASQHPALIPGTVAANLALGRPGAGRAAIEEAARLAGADRLVRRLPDGYVTVVGSGGARAVRRAAPAARARQGVVVLLLAALIARGVSFEFGSRRDGPRWRRVWAAATTYASALLPLLVGVALGNLLHGVPIGSDQEYAGNLLDLLNPYSLFCGVTLVLLCLLHGASFLALRTSGEIRERARRVGRRVGPAAAAAVVGFAVWTQATAGSWFSLPALVAVLAALAAVWQVGRGRDGLAFAATAMTMAAVVVTVFVALYPTVMVSTLGSANDLTVSSTASSPYSLKVMTVTATAAFLFPAILAYQGWTYYVFRRRVGAAVQPRAADSDSVANSSHREDAGRLPRS